jgi:DNA polymerase-2
VHHGVILQPTYRIHRDRPIVQLYGRLESGRAFLVEDDRFQPYFFVRQTDSDQLAGESGLTFRETELSTLAGEPVSRVSLKLPGEMHGLRTRLAKRGIPSFEADLRFAYRYLIDHALRDTIGIDGPIASQGQPGSSGAGAGLVRFINPSLVSSEAQVDLDSLSLDLETTPDASAIYSAALVGCGTEEVHLVSPSPVRGASAYASEAEMLVALAARIRELDPDILLGWNVVDFDLRVLQKRFEALGISTRDRCIGRLPGDIYFPGEAGFSRQSRAEVTGRMVVDGIPLVRDALRLPDYRLSTVAHSVLGRGKLIDEEAPDSAAEITRLYLEEPEALVAYNLEDARLVAEILEHEGLLNLARERSRLTGMQLDRVGASIASFDLVYLPELRIRGAVAPNVDSDRSAAAVTGGSVLEPIPGLARDVAVYDFKSLYPSLMRTFNIDPLALARGRREIPGAAIVAPNGARLSREEAILPNILKRFMAQRESAKQRKDRHADQAIKIMMNSMFGIFAAPACRFFSPELANAITRFGQQTLSWTCESFEKRGIRVVYGDTDSVFVQLPEADSHEEQQQRAESLRAEVAQEIAQRIQSEYDVEAQLDLELEKVFSRFLLPRVRGGKSGSKKRYAGWIGSPESGRLEIVGLESVRRDWPGVARLLQEGMLSRLFRDEEVLPFVREKIAALREGELDHQLIYAKRIRKGSLDRYTASSPPHVQAARKFEERHGIKAGPVIRYWISQAGPEPLAGKELPPADQIDRTHYLDKVMRPIADAILCEIGSSFAEALGEGQQLSLI